MPRTNGRTVLRTTFRQYQAPQVFDQDEDEGTVVVIDPQPPAELREAVLSAARSCPTGAIHVDKV